MTTTNTCRKLPDGTFQITVGGAIIRQHSKKAFTQAFDFGGGYIRLSNDSQLRRLRGEPAIIELEHIGV